MIKRFRSCLLLICIFILIGCSAFEPADTVKSSGPDSSVRNGDAARETDTSDDTASVISTDLPSVTHEDTASAITADPAMPSSEDPTPSDPEESPSAAPSDTAPVISQDPSPVTDDDPASLESFSITHSSSVVPEGSTFEIYFIDVGYGDSALILCDGEAMLIDGGKPEESQRIYAYLKRLSVDHLKYMVCTHVHDDHIGGLSGALNYAMAETVFCPQDTYGSEIFASLARHLKNQGKTITVPSAGDLFNLGSATVQIIGPVEESSDLNNTSIVLRVVYGETSFLFMGDAEYDEEDSIISSGYTVDSTVLKAGHHGSDTSSSRSFLSKVSPEYAVISVGDNLYGHPTENVLKNLDAAGAKVYRTDMQGEIYCSSDGKEIFFRVEKNENIDTLSVAEPDHFSLVETEDPGQQGDINRSLDNEEDEFDYILNTNSHKFHYPDCRSVKRMSERNKQEYHGTRQEVIDMGYDPCRNCNP